LSTARALADFGDVLGKAGVSLEGGGVFAHGGVGVAHFLVDDGHAALRALEAAGIRVLDVKDIVKLRLNQETPGQLGQVCRLMADAGVNIETQYSDHNNQLILVVDDLDAGRRVARAWSDAP